MNRMRVIRLAAQGRLDTVLAAIGVHERPRGRSIVMCNPVRGEAKESLQIWVKPGFEGAWKDYGAGIGGDVIDLVAYFKGWSAGGDKRGRKEAADFLADLLGIGDVLRSDAEMEALRQAVAIRRRQSLQDAGEQDELNRRAAVALWLKGSDTLASGPVETYLATRGLALDRLAEPPRALRWLPTHRHRESGLDLPCMIACMVRYAAEGYGRIVAVHRTWLAPDGLAKAEVTPQRKIWPAFAGAVVPLARGPSGLAVREACRHGIADTLVLTEGIEDGLSVALADPGLRVWAAGSLSNLAAITLPSCACDVIVCADNDWGKPQAQALLDKGLDHLRRQGRPVTTVRSTAGKDVNDLIRA